MNKIVIVGGDLRNYYLYELLQETGKDVSLIGFDKRDKSFAFSKELLSSANTVIGPIPFSTNGLHVHMPDDSYILSLHEFFSLIPEDVTLIGHRSIGIPDEITMVDITKNEHFALKNAIPTVEGMIEILIRESERTLHGSTALVLGFGRIGKRTSRILTAFGSTVTVCTKNNVEECIAFQERYDFIHLDWLGESELCFDYIVNTIPHQYLTREIIDRISGKTLVLDITSSVDDELIKSSGNDFAAGKGLPGRCAPRTAASYIYDTIRDLV